MQGLARWITVAWIAGWLGCGGGAQAPVGPSVLLVVLDTTRMDSISAYGEVEGTTPYLDSLAASGLLYRWAMAPSPWTLPSHASLFTSLPPERHGVGIAGRMALAEGHETLAARLAAAGYETIAFAENPLVMAPVGLATGFEHFEGGKDAAWLRSQGRPEARYDVVMAVRNWLAQRREDRPFFLFVNLFDPHDPYEPGEHTELPAGVSEAEAKALGRGATGQAVAEFAGICDRLPPERELEVLRSLYLGEVRAADDKLRNIHELLRAAKPGTLLTVVTADHGEHLGEHRLLGHEFSLRSELLRVPLVVHGLPGVAFAELEPPVELRDLAPSIASWVGVEPAAAWTGQPLPLAAAEDGRSEDERALLAFYADVPLVAPEGFNTRHEVQTSRRRKGCGREDRVYGEILSLVRFPFKLIHYAHHPPQLYDLRWDTRELSDISAHRPEKATELAAELERWGLELESTAADPPAGPASEETLEALRALGYVE